jgi:hypothetical protein
LAYFSLEGIFSSPSFSSPDLKGSKNQSKSKQHSPCRMQFLTSITIAILAIAATVTAVPWLNPAGAARIQRRNVFALVGMLLFLIATGSPIYPLAQLSTSTSKYANTNLFKSAIVKNQATMIVATPARTIPSMIATALSNLAAVSPIVEQRKEQYLGLWHAKI